MGLEFNVLDYSCFGYPRTIPSPNVKLLHPPNSEHSRKMGSAAIWGCLHVVRNGFRACGLRLGVCRIYGCLYVIRDYGFKA